MGYSLDIIICCTHVRFSEYFNQLWICVLILRKQIHNKVLWGKFDKWYDKYQKGERVYVRKEREREINYKEKWWNIKNWWIEVQDCSRKKQLFWKHTLSTSCVPSSFLDARDRNLNLSWAWWERQTCVHEKPHRAWAIDRFIYPTISLSSMFATWYLGCEIHDSRWLRACLLH